MLLSRSMYSLFLSSLVTFPAVVCINSGCPSVDCHSTRLDLPLWLESNLKRAEKLEFQANQMRNGLPTQGITGFRLRDDGIICGIQKGSSADGVLSENDVLISVNGLAVQGLSLGDMAELIKGPAGSTVEVDVERLGVGRLTSTLIRRAHIDSHLPMISSLVPDFLQGPFRANDNSVCGPGFSIEGDGLFVAGISPAVARTGVMKGDNLINVDGMKTVGLSNKVVSRLLHGQEGTTVNLLFKRTDMHGAHLIFTEVVRFPSHETVQQENPSSSEFEKHEAKPLLSSLAHGFGNIFSGWLGKSKV